MDSTLRQSLVTFLAGKESKQQSTIKWMMQRFERMSDMGFDFAKFATGLDPAEDEASRFIAELKMAGSAPGGIRNFQKNILALARLHRHRGFELALEREARPRPRIYSRTELDKLHSVPYKRNIDRRLMRALVLTHMAFGMRAGELARMHVTDLDVAASTFFVRFPEKGNPQRTLRVEEEVFRDNRPLMAWLGDRPVPKNNPAALWTYETRQGVAQQCPPYMVARQLQAAGRMVGVAANCIRGRHIRATALIYNGYKLPYVREYLGHSTFGVIHRYVELVDAELAAHLQGAKWLTKAPGGGKS